MAERGERRTPSSALELGTPTLADLGISKQRSFRWQAVADLTDEEIAERGERARAGDADGSGREPSVPTLADPGISKQ